ncbi:hypothetical protein AAE02nite_29590 [Adhaeribacter aerolatus]|uniref:Uncharacterized protein n=1 Tax=Adhaeribacter aerolatus TaxID=670289 RepID=A0A512AZZ7_9BACT|nr:hypothetical protein [Adhaeribacter aerolatus]GEO05295.1 hypothetical protein AAE02nite_29590 [Adhaeribacter aerolatus]
MEQENISFTTSLNVDDWDNNLGGWRCPSLKIPGAEIDAIFSGGQKIDDGKYQILKKHHIIRWADNTPPAKVLASITLTKELTTKELSSKWKKLAIVLPFLATVLTAIISNYSPKGLLKNTQTVDTNENTARKPITTSIDTFRIMFPRGLRAVVSSTNLSQDSVVKDNPSKYLRNKGIALGRVDEGLKKAYAGLVQKSPEEIKFVPWIVDGKPIKIGYSYAIQNAGPISTAQYNEVQLFQGDYYFTIYIHKTSDGEPQGPIIEPTKSGINWDFVKSGISQALEELYLRKKYVEFGDLGVFQEPGGEWEYRLEYTVRTR